MTPLNLPSFEYKIKNHDGKVMIYDLVRKKWVVLTPEEWVRQHFLFYMMEHLQYPRTLIKVESGIKFNTLKKRSDIVVYNRSAMPWLIVECKSPAHMIDQRTLQQASVYNASIRAPFLALTNGLTHVCCKIDHQQGKTSVLESFPLFT